MIAEYDELLASLAKLDEALVAWGKAVPSDYPLLRRITNEMIPLHSIVRQCRGLTDNTVVKKAIERAETGEHRKTRVQP